ncbi:hypothetical protein [Streptomyces sp. NPDC048269]
MKNLAAVRGFPPAVRPLLLSRHGGSTGFHPLDVPPPWTTAASWRKTALP